VAGQAGVAAVRVQLDRQNLVQLNDLRFEAQTRAGIVRPHTFAGATRPLRRPSSQCSTRLAPATVSRSVNGSVGEVSIVHDFEADVVLRSVMDAP